MARGANIHSNIDIEERDRKKVSAELTGMDDNDVEVNLNRDSLTISGGKREDKSKDCCHVEPSQGAFTRTIPACRSWN